MLGASLLRASQGFAVELTAGADFISRPPLEGPAPTLTRHRCSLADGDTSFLLCVLLLGHLRHDSLVPYTRFQEHKGGRETGEAEPIAFCNQSEATSHHLCS